MEKRRNAKEHILLFSTIFSIYLLFQESNYIFICEMWLFDLFFPQFYKSDMSRCRYLKSISKSPFDFEILRVDCSRFFFFKNYIFICEMWLFDLFFPQFYKSDMSRCRYLKSISKSPFDFEILRVDCSRFFFSKMGATLKANSFKSSYILQGRKIVPCQNISLEDESIPIKLASAVDITFTGLGQFLGWLFTIEP